MGIYDKISTNEQKRGAPSSIRHSLSKKQKTPNASSVLYKVKE